MSGRRPASGPLLLAHGGAGARRVTAAQRACLREALVAGSTLLQQGGTALAAVEETIRLLESSGLFNAGTGARLQLDGVRRMDASLMEGRTLRAGAVAGIEQIRNPISAARLVMEHTAHVLLVGRHATRFARHFKLDVQPPLTDRDKATLRGVNPKGSQRRTLALYAELAQQYREETEGAGGTVGAVALDRQGSLAAGASTGGLAFMLPGRVGDSPLLGCGVYADDEAGAVSMTGMGESIMRIAAAKDIVDRLARGMPPKTAARLTLTKLAQRIGGEARAGALVLSPRGQFTIQHNSVRLCAGSWTGRGTPVVADRFPP